MSSPASPLTPEQWDASIQAIIDWIDPHIQQQQESEKDTFAARSDPKTVRNAIELMINVSKNGYESYGNPAVHARYLHKTNQFTRMKITRFLAQEFDSPYVEDHPILSHYFEILNIKGQSIIQSLRTYFVKYRLDTPFNINELNNLLYCLAVKYCHDNEEIRENSPQNKENGKNHLTIDDANNVSSSSESNTKNKNQKLIKGKIDKKTNVFIGDADELLKIYHQCIASQQSLHGTVAVGRVRANTNKFVETLNGELINDSFDKFS